MRGSRSAGSVAALKQVSRWSPITDNARVPRPFLVFDRRRSPRARGSSREADHSRAGVCFGRLDPPLRGGRRHGSGSADRAHGAALVAPAAPWGSPLGVDADTRINGFLAQLRKRLAQGASIYIHCSAGIHRTGMIGACLLHFLGLGPEDVKEALEIMRPVTSQGASHVPADRRGGRCSCF